MATVDDLLNMINVALGRTDGADVGVWKSSDGGGTWAHLGPDTGMPNVPVYDLEIHPVTRQPFAFTFGRGAFVLACRGDAECDRARDFAD